jgi:hypothetical protein
LLGTQSICFTLMLIPVQFYKGTSKEVPEKGSLIPSV